MRAAGGADSLLPMAEAGNVLYYGDNLDVCGATEGLDCRVA